MPETNVALRRLTAALLTLAVAGAAALSGAPAQAAGRLVPISGTGSTWSQNALDQWKSNVKKYGMTVNYGGGGSTAGRSNFRDGTVDFAVTEIPYGVEKNDNRPNRKFAYMPIVAGGTAFMYNLKIGGKRVTNLRLSGEVIARIFTGQIAKWNDPAIKADNPGLALPARKVIPVVRSDGSGTTAQFVTWLDKRHAAIWHPYCTAFRQASECSVTSFYPYRSGTAFVGQSGSLGVSGYVAQNQGEGAITYVEYSYATKNRFPVAKVLNQAGYYVEPTAENVAVALTRARIEPSDLTQRLDGVYTFTDPRTYQLSSYSYMVVPVEELKYGFNENKGYTLGRFAYYFLCEGQRQAKTLGYSPLPINLVKAGFEQVKRIQGVEAQNIKVESCNNPTFSRDGTNTLAKEADMPPPCDRKGPTQCATGTGGAPEKTPTKGTGTGTGSGTGTGTTGTGSAAKGTGTTGTGAGTTGTGTTGTGTGADAAAPAAGAAVVDPDTGQVIATGGQSGGAEAIAGVPVSLDGVRGWQVRHTMMMLSALLLIGLVVGPPLLMRRLRVDRAGQR